MSDVECPVCGNEDEEMLDAKHCIQCKRLVCIGCIQWSGEDHDEPNGEWFCVDCIDRHARDLIHAEAVRVKMQSFLDWFCGDE